MRNFASIVKTDPHGRELKEHGTTLFPIACYDNFLRTGETPWHWHDECEASVMISGSATVLADGKEYEFNQGEGFFINSSVLHSIRKKPGTGFHYHTVVFHPRLVSGGIDSIIWLRYVEPLISDPACRCVHFDRSVSQYQAAIQYIDKAWQSCVSECAGYEFIVREYLSQLVYLLSGDHSALPEIPSERELRDEKRIKLMLQYIHEHYAEELTIDKIARCAAISESECLRCFHRIIGVTPIKYVIQFRIQKAADLLADSGLKVMDIGAMCGFQDMSYFARAFQKVKDCTPLEYRRNRGK